MACMCISIVAFTAVFCDMEESDKRCLPTYHTLVETTHIMLFHIAVSTALGNCNTECNIVILVVI